jgi:hypothetical protein
MGRICSTDQNLYAKIFGTAQNYDELLNNNPNSVA